MATEGMNTMLQLITMLATLKKDDSGATAIEYGLIAGLIAVALIAALAAFTPTLTGLFGGIGGALGTATPQ